MIGHKRQQIGEFLTETERQILFGQVNSDVFERNRVYVDERLSAVAPVEGVDGRTRKMSDDMYIARLCQYVAEQARGTKASDVSLDQVKALAIAWVFSTRSAQKVFMRALHPTRSTSV